MVRTQRLVFRSLTADNLVQFHALVCDEHIRRYLLDGQNMSLTWCSDILKSTSEEQRRSGLGLWLLCEHGNSTPFGFAGYLRFEGPASPLQLLYAVCASHTGLGHASEAAVAMIDLARELGVRTGYRTADASGGASESKPANDGDIVAAVDTPNVDSSKLLTRLGFACTGQVPGAFGPMLQYRLVRGRPPRERRTERLRLRPLRTTDREVFAALNADPRVMQHFPDPLTRKQSDALLDRMLNDFESRGFGPWAVELLSTGGCIGFVGLDVPSFSSHFTPCVEVAWRLAAEHWGCGYAQEAARAALHTAFVHLELPRVVSFTTLGNERSARVMQKLGMQRDPNEDFEHPNLAPGHALRPHLLYRLDAATWRKSLGPNQSGSLEGPQE